jgi:hypothetical protein
VEQHAAYIRRFSDRDLERDRSDLEVLADFARQQGWKKDEVELFTNFLAEVGVRE